MSERTAQRKPDFTIIIPAFNEESGITEVIDQLKSVEGEPEIIVVDDGSTDATASKVEESGVSLCRHDFNRGYGAALKTGISQAKTDIIVIIDADGTYPSESIPDLVRIFKDESCDMVVGARTKANAAIPLVRRPAKWCLARLANYLTRTKIPDLNSGLRVMRREAVEFYKDILPDGFSFTTTITIAMISEGRPVKFAPVDYYKRRGKSKIRPVQDTLNFIALIVRTSLLFAPLRTFLPVSLFFILAGILIMAYELVVHQNVNDSAVVMLFAGIQLFAIGVLADVFGRRPR